MIEWDVAMIEEFYFLMKNPTWDHVLLPKGHMLVHCKWVYITKYGAYRYVDKHQPCFVAKGFSKVEGLIIHIYFPEFYMHCAFSCYLLRLVSQLDGCEEHIFAW
jgi:hypothetical protein